MRFRLITAFLVVSSSAAAQQPAAKTFELTIPNIMRGPEVYGREPQRVQWSADGRWLYLQWNPPGTDWREPSHL
jgi:hypothetical protein